MILKDKDQFDLFPHIKKDIFEESKLIGVMSIGGKLLEFSCRRIKNIGGGIGVEFSTNIVKKGEQSDVEKNSGSR